MHQEAVKAAVLQIRKGGGKWHLKPLVPVASSKLGSRTKYLFHKNGARILALKQPPGSVEDGLRLYQESIGRAYRYVDKAGESNTLEFYAAQESSPNFVPASRKLDPSLSAAPSLVL